MKTRRLLTLPVYCKAMSPVNMKHVMANNGITYLIVVDGEDRIPCSVDILVSAQSLWAQSR